MSDPDQYTDKELAAYGLDRQLYIEMRSWLAENHLEYSSAEYLVEACAEYFGQEDWSGNDEHPAWDMAEVFYASA